MNIMLFTPFTGSDTGGVSVFVTRLQESLGRRGHRAFVLEATGHRDRITPVHGGAPLTFAVNLRHISVKGATTIRSHAAFWVYLPLVLYDLWTFLRRERIDVVHMHFPTPRSLYLALLRPVSRWRLVVTLHGSDIKGRYGLPQQSWLYAKLLGLTLSLADRITTVSTDLLEILLARYSRLRARCVAIPNGTPFASLRSDTCQTSLPLNLPEDYILAVGNLIPRKGYDVLLRAIGLMRDRGRRTPFVIVGDGEELDTLSAMVKELDIDDQVVFAGNVAHDAIPPFYASAKCLVHPARQEGLPLAILEAMASRKAVIATRVGGIPEVVRDGITGLLVDPDDPESLANAIVRIEENEQLRWSLACRGHDSVLRDHNWDAMVDRYLEQYELALKGSGARWSEPGRAPNRVRP